MPILRLWLLRIAWSRAPLLSMRWDAGILMVLMGWNTPAIGSILSDWIDGWDSNPSAAPAPSAEGIRTETLNGAPSNVCAEGDGGSYGDTRFSREQVASLSSWIGYHWENVGSPFCRLAGSDREFYAYPVSQDSNQGFAWIESDSQGIIQQVGFSPADLRSPAPTADVSPYTTIGGEDYVYYPPKAIAPPPSTECPPE